MRATKRPCLTFAMIAAVALASASALAQPAPAPEKPAADPDKLGPGKEAVKDKPDPIALALAPQPGGLTFESVAKEAIKTSPAVRGKEAELAGSEGAVTSAIVSFVPRVTLGASYTRVSEVDSTLGGGALVGAATEGPLGVAPCPTNAAVNCVVDSAGLPVQAQAFSLSSTIPNQVAFTLAVTVPISDYFLRAVQAYNAAEHNEKSLKMSTDAQRLAVVADAKITLLNWVLARGQTIVASASVESAKNQLADMKALRRADKGSDADVLRIEALVAQAEYTEAEARSLEATAESRLRIVMHAPPDRPFAIGVDVLATPTLPKVGAVDELVAEALKNRLEILSTEEAIRASKEVESTTNAGYWPRLDGFADVLVADPNSRIFPQKDQFDATWDFGLRLSWTLNETFSTIGASKQAKARTQQIDAQKRALIDSVRLEVTQAYAEVVRAAPSIAAADKGVKSAEESLRITKLVYSVGSSTGTALADAENALTTARLRQLSAHVGAHAAIVRLEHALGRDRGSPLAPRPKG